MGTIRATDRDGSVYELAGREIELTIAPGHD